jgi:glycosyltransferase involved in cell wall biosynthesis
MGDRVTVLTRRLRSAAPIDGHRGATIFRVGWPLLRGPGFLLAAWWWIIRHGPVDVVHAHQAHTGAVVAAWTPRRYARRTAVKLAGLDIPAGPGLRARARRTALRRIDIVAAVNPTLRDEATALGVGPVHMVPNGVDVHRFKPAPDPGVARSRLGWEADAPTVLYVGRLEPVKGADVLLDAWSRVRTEQPHAQLWVVGSGSEAISLLAADRRSVVFSGWLSDPSPLYQAADLLVVPSRSEGLSNVLLEGMASGLATVASDVAGNSCVLADGKNGRLVPPDDAGALAEVIIELLADEEQRRRLGQAARATVEERYRLSRIEECWAAHYAGPE